MKKWEKTNKRFVAYFDIMGFKDYVYRNNHDNVVKMMETLADEIIKPIDNMYLAILKKLSPIEYEYLKIVRPILFSDSIVLISMGNTKNDFTNISMISMLLIGNCIKHKIPLKGSISYGTFTADFDKSIYIGRPLIDAYLLQDQLSTYGCVIDNNVEDFLGKYEDLKWPLIQYKTPLKSGMINHFNLNWPRLGIIVNRDEPTVLELVKSLFILVSGEPRKYIDNTIDFVNYCLSK